MKIKKVSFAVSAAIAGIISASSTFATEGGGSSYPMGADNYLSAALPPPGFYTMLFAERYSADTLRDNSGNKIPVNFKVTANVAAPRFIWVTGQKFMGGDVLHAAIVPLVNLDVNVNGAGQTKTGLGDILLTAFGVGYHHSANLHSVAAVDIVLPTGSYDRNDLANIGRNYWAIQPLYAVTYVNPNGWNLDAKIMYDFNLKNKDTNYKSGQEFHVDYAVGYGFGNNWVAGVGGYLYQQTTDDKLNGVTVANNKGRAFAIGPSIKYDNGKDFFLTAKYQMETNVRNRADGKAFWVKALLPF